MNGLQVFKNNEFSIKSLVIDNEPWFVGKDVAAALGYRDTSDALKKHVDNDDKLTRRFADSGQNREMYIINESGLYSLILSSKLESAKRFKRWVTSEVLPAIRKTGGYQLPEISYPQSLRLLADEIEKNKKLELENSIQAQQINEMKPKADYCDKILSSKSLMTITQIAKDYGMSGKAMNQILHDLNIQYKQSGQWLLYSRYQSKGYTSSETIDIKQNDGKVLVRLSTKWTQKGRLYLYERLKKEGYLPLIEQE